MKIREKRRMTQNKGVSVEIRETWQVCTYMAKTIYIFMNKPRKSAKNDFIDYFVNKVIGNSVHTTFFSH